MPTKRQSLTRELIVHAAIDLADAGGLDAVTMRRLGTELGVEAMSLYNHVTNKDDLIDAMLASILAVIEVNSTTTDWRTAARQRAVSLRTALRQHPWALGLMERQPTLSNEARDYAEAVLAQFQAAGFAAGNAGLAFWLIDSVVYGHVLQETAIEGAISMPNEPQSKAHTHRRLQAERDHAATTATTTNDAFEFSLDLVLDALDSRRNDTQSRR